MKTLDKLRVPVIQGGMGVGISLGGLAGAVAREGGMGVISTANIGFREADFGRMQKRRIGAHCARKLKKRVTFLKERD